MRRSYDRVIGRLDMPCLAPGVGRESSNPSAVSVTIRVIRLQTNAMAIDRLGSLTNKTGREGMPHGRLTFENRTQSAGMSRTETIL